MVSWWKINFTLLLQINEKLTDRPSIYKVVGRGPKLESCSAGEASRDGRTVGIRATRARRQSDLTKP